MVAFHSDVAFSGFDFTTALHGDVLRLTGVVAIEIILLLKASPRWHIPSNAGEALD